MNYGKELEKYVFDCERGGRPVIVTGYKLAIAMRLTAIVLCRGQ